MSKAILTVDPVPSGAASQVCIIQISARVRLDPGTNCLGSIFLSSLDFNLYSMIMFSAIFDNVDVRDIGCKFLLKSVTFLALGMGATSAIFHALEPYILEKMYSIYQ